MWLRLRGRHALGISLIYVLCIAASAAQAEDGFRLLQIDGHVMKWGPPRFGQGATLTYAVALRNARVHGTVNCTKIAPVGRLLEHSGLTSQSFDMELRAAFAMWEAAANIRFVPAKSLAKANLLIAAEAVPDGIAYADVTPASSKMEQISSTKKGIVCLNPLLAWTIAGKSTQGDGQTSYRLKYVLAHEIGHVLGLDHPGPSGELMSFEYTTGSNGLQVGDIAGIVTLYGRAKAAPLVALNGAKAAAP